MTAQDIFLRLKGEIGGETLSKCWTVLTAFTRVAFALDLMVSGQPVPVRTLLAQASSCPWVALFAKCWHHPDRSVGPVLLVLMSRVGYLAIVWTAVELVALLQAAGITRITRRVTGTAAGLTDGRRLSARLCRFLGPVGALGCREMALAAPPGPWGLSP